MRRAEEELQCNRLDISSNFMIFILKLIAGTLSSEMYLVNVARQE